ncbi:MAG: hypothetical protein JWQ11_673 [Rhizobacter sp.]|nr:hypothetical protein [Rhizobacter sp.]
MNAASPITLASSLDALGDWRSDLLTRLAELVHFLREHELLDEPAAELCDSLRERLSTDKLMVAFVAEFSRGKSELINAIFFSDAGRRVLPASPGRTTMCPVELAYDAEEPPSIAMLPIDTRLDSLSLAELRGQPKAWTRVRLDDDRPEKLSQMIGEVTRTKWVSVNEARALGLWDDAHPHDNPRVDAGLVEVPAWRHVVINYPHPLLKRGLVVLDTPGLNAIGAEPELTLGLLPHAHAIVFILGADTGVTKSDLAIWNDHLGGQALNRFVVLNKIDTLVDPLATPQQVQVHIETQRLATARLLDVPASRVFALSARQALAARMAGDEAGLAASRLMDLEIALGHQLLPQRRQVIGQMVAGAATQLEEQMTRRLADRRGQLAEQLLELRSLRGKSDGKLKLMLARIDDETREFEQCAALLHAMRAVHARLLKELLAGLSSERLTEQVAELLEAMQSSMLNLGARKAFSAMCQRLRQQLRAAESRGKDLHSMLGASFGRLNAEYAFALSLPTAPSFDLPLKAIDPLEQGYMRYLGLGQALRLSQPKFMEQFRRMLVSRLRAIFDAASADIELWNKTASSQIDSQLRERRRNFRRRRESMERIQVASAELDARLGEMTAQDDRLKAFAVRVGELTQQMRVEV